MGACLFPSLLYYNIVLLILSQISMSYDASVFHYAVVCKVDIHEPYLPVLVNKTFCALNNPNQFGDMFYAIDVL